MSIWYASQEMWHTFHPVKSGIRSAFNPSIWKIYFSNSKEFCKIKITQVHQAWAEFSENWYPRCQFSHLRCDFRFISWVQDFNNSYWLFHISGFTLIARDRKKLELTDTVKTLGMDTSLIRTPLYYRQFPVSQQNSQIFSLKKTLSNTDNGH